MSNTIENIENECHYNIKKKKPIVNFNFYIHILRG